MIILPTIVVLGEILNLFANLENYGINEHNRPDFDVRVRRNVKNNFNGKDVIETSYIINNLLNGVNRKLIKRYVDEKNKQEKDYSLITYYGFNRSDVLKNPFYRSGDSTYYNPYSSTEYFTQNTPLPIPDNVDGILITNQNVTTGDDKDNVEVAVKKRDTSGVNNIQTFKHKPFLARLDEKPKLYNPYSTTGYYTQNTPMPYVPNVDIRYGNNIREDMSKINTYRDRVSERYNKNAEIVKKNPVNVNNENQNSFRNDRLTNERNESYRNNHNDVFYYGFETTTRNNYFNYKDYTWSGANVNNVSRSKFNEYPGNFAQNQSYGSNINYSSTTNYNANTSNGFNGIYANTGDNENQILYGNYSNGYNDTSIFGTEFNSNTNFNATNAFKAPNGLNKTTPIVEIKPNVTEKIVQGYVLGFSACASGYRRVLMRCVPIEKNQ